MKRIYQAADLVDAELMVDRLQNESISVQVFNQHIGGGFGELPASYPEIWVSNDEDQYRAEQVVQRVEQQRMKPHPERICTQCKERNPASFELCWCCQCPLEDG